MITVFIIDDSVLFRTQLTKTLESIANLQVVGTANDAAMAEKKLKLLKDVPNIVILDIEMPKVDGLTFLKDILSKLDTKVIVCTSYYEKYKKEALKYGAASVLDKKDILQDSKTIISQIEKLSASSRPTMQRRTFAKNNISKVVVIGSSTGGLDVISTILKLLPSNTPPILIVQHLGRDIFSTLLPTLQETTKVKLKEAQDGEDVLPNTVYFAPFATHLKIKKISYGSYKIELNDDEKVSYHKPSIDVLFNSAAKEVGKDTSAFLLTGMGFDGVDGIANIKKQGGFTFAQDEQSSQVFGMAKVAIEKGVIDKVLSPKNMLEYML